MILKNSLFFRNIASVLPRLNLLMFVDDLSCFTAYAPTERLPFCSVANINARGKSEFVQRTQKYLPGKIQKRCSWKNRTDIFENCLGGCFYLYRYNWFIDYLYYIKNKLDHKLITQQLIYAIAPKRHLTMVLLLRYPKALLCFTFWEVWEII